MGVKKEYLFQAEIEGQCLVVTTASSEEEATENIKNGLWELEKDSHEWDANVSDDTGNGIIDNLVETREIKSGS